MATIEVSPDVRSRLRLFLTERFSLSELKNLSFDLGVDYEMFPHQTKSAIPDLIEAEWPMPPSPRESCKSA